MDTNDLKAIAEAHRRRRLGAGQGKWLPAGETPSDMESMLPMLAPLLNGGVLATAQRKAWRYDGARWVPVEQIPIDMLDNVLSQCVGLHDGRVLAMGWNTDFDPDSDLDRSLSSVFDPRTNSWSIPSRMAVQRAAYGSTVLRDGRVLVAGGFDVTTAYPAQYSEGLRSTELYDPKAGMWRQAPHMQTPRMEMALASPPNIRGALAFGGNMHMFPDPFLVDPTDTVEMFVVDSDGYESWIPMPSMQQRRYDLTAQALPDGRVVVVSGDSLEVFNSVRLTWEPLVPLLPVPSGKPAVTGLLSDGTVLIGTDQVYDPGARVCRRIDPFPVPRRLPAYCTICPGRVMVWTDQPTDGAPSAWIFDCNA
jgi:hypothetical protein